MTLMVVGARPGSLGAWIARYAERANDEKVVTVGIGEDDEHYLDVTSPGSVWATVGKFKPSSIICTAGINLPDAEDLVGDKQMEVNYVGVMRLLRHWLASPAGLAGSGQFVAVSSNSAHIARTGSAGYCASKAALSMGIRCVAREVARREMPVQVYGWEFGLLAGTPMTADVRARLGADVPLTRMPGLPQGMPVAEAADLVVAAYVGNQRGLNGSLLRVDGGEQ